MIEKFDWPIALAKYTNKQPKDWHRVPVKAHSSARMGGWLMKDNKNMYVGWVGYRGDITYMDYEETKPNGY